VTNAEFLSVNKGAGMMDRQRAPTGLVVAAFVMTFSSTFGQTYFIGVFVPWLKSDLGLSDSVFGGFYTIGTLASACLLALAGRVADRFRIRWLAVAVIVSLAMTSVAMANVSAAWVLLPILFGLRVFGQGWPAHLAAVGVGRWYVRRRGRMMSIAMLGSSVSAAISPIIAVALISIIGWRQTWLSAAAFLCTVSVPLVLFFLRNEPSYNEAVERSDAAAKPTRDWTREEVLRRPEFYAVLSGVSASAFVMTGIFFHQAALVADKGWTLAWFAAWFPAHAITSVLATLVTGWLIDRFGSRRLLPLFLIPMTVAVLVLSLTTSPYAVPVFMVLGALTSGSSQALLGALWAELFGTRHLGAIRSVAYAAQVVASALAPGLMGVLLDAGVDIEDQCLAMVVYAAASVVWLNVIGPRLYRLTAE
jgi:MFS family permease